MSLPQQLLVEARLKSQPLEDPGAATAARLAARLDATWSGQRVAVAAGSRGIDRYAEVVRAVVAALKAKGARPFVIPAMGSHGGGTAPGQVEMLQSLGITEQTAGCPIVSTVETEEVARSPLGFRVLTSRDALSADSVVMINRVKPHTDFASPGLGSGLLKMSAIGLGKIEGAFECHQAASRHGYETVIREASRTVLARLPRVLGVALVEDGRHQLARVEVFSGREIEAQEPELLRQAREWMPSLPFPEIDLLILDEIGKNVSGAGMDTNIVGRGVDGRPRDDRKTTIRTLYVRGLTPESHGNAVGMGLADVVRTRLVAEMDPTSTYTNALSAMTPAMVRTPMHFASDAECLRAAIRMCGASEASARIVRVRNTLALGRLAVSAAFAPELLGREDLGVIGSATEWAFDEAGDIAAGADLLAAASA
jgi:nucleotide-binding universal stress UspA family protein